MKGMSVDFDNAGLKEFTLYNCTIARCPLINLIEGTLKRNIKLSCISKLSF